MKRFNTGVIVGRFQHIHIGHEKLINTGLELCNKVLILVSCSNEYNNIQNPYDYDYRVKLIKKIYSDDVNKGKIIIKPIDDSNFKGNLSHKLGKYILNKCILYIGNIPECIIYGNDKDIYKCFDNNDVKNISKVQVDRKVIDISATKIREYLLNGDIDKWKKFVNKNIYDEYDNLREISNKFSCKK